MSLISAIVALCKALPVLERLFLSVSDAIREAKAKARYDAKLTHIDNAMRTARGVRNGAGIEWSQDPDRTPPVSEGSTFRTRVDHGGTGENSGVGIRN